MAKKDEDTQQLPAVNLKTETHPEAMIPTFADKLESLMNQAVHASVPAPNETANEYHYHFAAWANHLGDLWREVKQHAK